MERHQIKDMVEEFAEKRLEGFIQTQHGLMEAFKDRIITAVQEQIKVTVNGKIDKLATQVEELRKDVNKTKPLVTAKDWVYSFFKGIMWVSGVIVAIGSAVLVIIKLTK